MDGLPNYDPALEDPEGVPVKAMIFGGRDSDTSVPVEQSFDWVHGVITKGASLESETTAATLGAEGVREFNPMSNLDFLAASLDTYLQKYLEFAAVLAKPPAIFAVNYFLKGSDGAVPQHDARQEGLDALDRGAGERRGRERSRPRRV